MDSRTDDKSSSAVRVHGACYQYPQSKRERKSGAAQRLALDGVDLDIARGEIFALLGPNGGGKTTLFRILSTSLPIQTGEVDVLGHNLHRNLFEIRRRIGVVFQHPSLDKKLTVRENLVHHARLYGLSRGDRERRIAEALGIVGLSQRASELVETLSGGLARRAEIAKSLLHSPELLILDEPSTGLDPAGRADLWKYLSGLPAQGVTILATTHLMEEAEKARRIAILDHGRIVALGPPDELRGQIGGEVVTIAVDDPTAFAQRLRESFKIEADVSDDRVRFEQSAGYHSIAALVDLAGPAIHSISVAKPTLEDVFLKRTGHRFWSQEVGQPFQADRESPA